MVTKRSKQREEKLVKAAVETGGSQTRDVINAFMKHKVSVVALVVLVLILIAAIVSGFIFSEEQITSITASARLQPPSAEHWFGTDSFGRDVFARTIYGARYSLFFGLTTAAFALVIGTAIGSACAYFGGTFDIVVMRIMDSLVCIPSLLLMLALVAVIGRGMHGIIIALVVTSVPGTARIVRSIVIGVVQNEYVEAARAAGVTTPQIIWRHVLPNAFGPILVNVLMNISGSIISASSMSFLGMGVQPPTPEWGAMINDALPLIRTSPYLIVFPGIAVLVTSLCFNLLGDGLTDSLDPHSR